MNEKVKSFFAKIGLCFLLLSFSCWATFSETVYRITESELNQILAETETMKGIVSEQSSQLSQLRKLSQELRSEAESQKKKAQVYKGIAIGACVSSVILGGAVGTKGVCDQKPRFRSDRLHYQKTSVRRRSFFLFLIY